MKTLKKVQSKYKVGFKGGRSAKNDLLDSLDIQNSLDLIMLEECLFPHYWRYLAMWRLFTRRGVQNRNKERIYLENLEWVLYMDLDAMFTNYGVKVEQILERYTMITTGLVLAADTKCYDERYPINNGIMLFKNGDFSLQLVFQVLSKQAYRESLLYDDSNWWNAKGLKDQPLLTNILVRDKIEIDSEKILRYCNFTLENGLDLNGIIYSSDFVTVVSPRVMNSVRRSSTHFRKDNLLWHWRSGDWIAHLSGLTPMAPALRRKFIKQVCDSSPDEVCPFEIVIDTIELISVENKLSLIRYKKELKLSGGEGPKKRSEKNSSRKNKVKDKKQQGKESGVKQAGSTASVASGTGDLEDRTKNR
ncbi:nitronate monooxygenase [Cryptosporidium felis]|nr:nitronate monooxygenase [Cryptosporidium felis]